MACIVPNHEKYLAVVTIVWPDQMGEVEPGDGRRGYRPGSRYGPIAAIDKLRGRIGQTGRLRLGKNDRGIDSSYLSGAGAAVITEPVNVQAIAPGVGSHFKKNSLAHIYADISGKSLDARIARAANLPVRIPRLLIFAGHRVRAGLRLARHRKACKRDRKMRKA